MAKLAGHSEACCSIPPIHATADTPPKGRYETINVLKTYVTGDKSATKGLLFIPDVFGYYPQTVQGADILAHSDPENKYQVFIPDFLEGVYPDISWYPPDTPEKEKLLGHFFETAGAPPRAIAKLPSIISGLQSFSPGVKSFGVVGFCWGGKIISLYTSGKETVFKAAAECHPAFVDPEEAKGITIPLCMLASGDEPVEDVKKFEANLKPEHHVETFKDMVHGWMTAKGDFKDERKKAEYERGYQVLLEFFAKHIK